MKKARCPTKRISCKCEHKKHYKINIEKIGENEMSQNTKTILSNLFTLTSELSEPTSKLIHIEGVNETPATQKDLANGLRDNLINLTEVLGLSLNELTEPQEYEPQETLKSIIEEMQQLTFAPHEISGNDVQVFADLLTDNIERLIKALGLNDMSLSAESKNKLQEFALKAQVQELYSLNDSMITADPNHVPKYTDGTIITLSDLVDMNVQALDNIAELIGFELEE